MREQVERRGGEVFGADAEFLAQEVRTQRPLVERELDVESGRQRLFHFLDRFVAKALGLERGVVDRRRLAERTVADGVDLDLADLRTGIAEHAERFRHRADAYLEVTATGE